MAEGQVTGMYLPMETVAKCHMVWMSRHAEILVNTHATRHLDPDTVQNTKYKIHHFKLLIFIKSIILHYCSP